MPKKEMSEILTLSERPLVYRIPCEIELDKEPIDDLVCESLGWELLYQLRKLYPISRKADIANEIPFTHFMRRHAAFSNQLLKVLRRSSVYIMFDIDFSPRFHLLLSADGIR